MELSNRRFWLLVAGATLAIMLGCWLSSGTMAPYGTTMSPNGTRDFSDCGYRMNGDHWHHQALFKMLDGQPRPDWETSVLLRRVLYGVLGYPFMKAFGFEAGGILLNILLHGAALIALALALRRYFDPRAAVLACWLFASYPGYAYWAGVPYVNAIIVPGSIACTIALLWWNDQPSSRRSVAAACAIGFVALGYDIMPFFGVALMMMVAMKRRWVDLALVVAVLAAWAAFIAVGVPAIFDFPVRNSNTEVYNTIVHAYLDAPNRWHGWPSLLFRVPRVFFFNFFYCNMLFFPMLLLWLCALRWRFRIRPLLGPVALTVLLASLALFLFLNLAPPYPGWQMRGTWISRLYQPSFIVVLILVAATSVALREQLRRYKLFFWSIVAVASIDGLAIVGPYVGIDKVYVAVNERFYIHESLRHNHEFLAEHGTRPYGICK